MHYHELSLSAVSSIDLHHGLRRGCGTAEKVQDQIVFGCYLIDKSCDEAGRLWEWKKI